LRKERADKLLVERGLAETRRKAQALIMAGVVTTAGRRRVEKAGQLLPGDAPLDIAKPLPYVSRGGLKLADALEAFGLELRGLVCADIGSSTGGFTDCLLQRGAVRVYAVDVDIRQLDDRLRRDPRVVAVEKNARLLDPDDFPERPAVVAMDVSFISATKILPAVRACLAPPVDVDDRRSGGETLPAVLVLIKPQFEAGKGLVGKKGIVRDPALQAAVLSRVIREAASLGFRLRGLHRSATRGQKGNQEFFARFGLGGLPPSPEDVLKWVAEVTRA
jgi:23S rRNA (cytidine1920-2'-O)/16S rRNA (cytidine1409-2'-O)-methyltransferase